MAKTELKTKVNDASVTQFLNRVADEQSRKDCFAVLKLMHQATKEEPKMWGSSIVGFGSYHYKGKSGREGDWMLVGFSPRKQNLTLYLMGGLGHARQLAQEIGQVQNQQGLFVHQATGRRGQKGLEGTGAGIGQASEATRFEG